MTKEEQFYQALEGIFVGAPVEGESGYINLMRIKSRYYHTGVFPQLQRDIEEALKPFPDFRDELFLKLYTFFKRYFSKSGSIYFDSTPVDQNIYEKVYTDDRDVMLFWKTHMLYYVKTDRLFKNLDTEIDGSKFHFDVATLEHKRANEKRDIVYELKEIKDDVLVFSVYYSEKGRKTNTDNILRELTKAKVKITEDTLEKAFRVFEKQSEVDYFINKNARAFLKEQFDLWLYQYVFSGESQWTETRIKQLQVLKDIACKIIDFIAQFENELVRIWNKPKFVLNSNYVITLDRIAGKDIDLVSTLIKHHSFNEQVAEWKQLGIVNDAFDLATIITGSKKSPALNPKCAHLPIDTKYFKDLELNIIGLFDDLDNALDGWLIKSENYQALNTVLPKFKEKVQLIYIDPPFNTGEDFFYADKFQDSTWLSLIWDRIRISKDLLGKEGAFYLHIDRNSDHLSKVILNNVFGEDNFKAEITWDTCGITGFKSSPNNWIKNADYLMYYSKSINHNFFVKTYSILDREEKKRLGIGWLDILGTEHSPYVEKWHKGTLINEPVETEHKLHPIGMLWTDVYSFLFTQVGNNESFFFNTQKPEHLLRRIIQSSTSQRGIVLDFFLGIGTTIAVAQKLNRKWIGVEMADYADTVYEIGDERKIGALGRMKIVVSGDQKFSVFGHPRHPQLSRNLNWQGGGFFKYYELEQYEDTLRKVKYEDSDLFDTLSQDPYNQYIFLRDLKMLEALEVDYENNKVKVDLQKMYPNIDIPETLSNLLGKYIKKIKPNEVEFEGGERIDLSNLDYKLIKPLIWW
ncbi:MAG: site-specific DNA-methyltransferase [Dehalococcoidia bacterium]|nr:site-specific DNA-methyltransferase [Dehalococcoidia bacterium]